MHTSIPKADSEILRRTAAVKTAAAGLGFDACGVASAAQTDPGNNLGKWIDLGYHADMDWLPRTRKLRQDVRAKVPGAQSVVVVARNYHHPRPAAPENTGRIASYAWGRDYHRVLKKPLHALGDFIVDFEDGARSYASIDSGPVLERTWAERAGVAAIGKNSLGLRRDLGSWFFLATIITTVELAPDEPATDICGSCSLCIDACPTGAITEPRVVDSRQCISYQTIENRGDIPESLHKGQEDWLFGCDICQEVCPWNRFAKISDEKDFAPREGHGNPRPIDILEMDEARFKAEFSGTPVLRAKYQGMQRNAKIVLRNLDRAK